MDETLAKDLENLSDELIGAGDEVSAAIESGEDQRQLAIGRVVQELAQRYTTLLKQVPDSERDRIERTIGRRVTDLRRSAAQLTQRATGQAVQRAADAGFVPFLLRRDPPKTVHSASANIPRERPRFSVGGEVEAWCGKCGGVRDHHIVAMVGDEPKQVICQSCSSRHGYRTEPARKGPAKPVTLEEKRVASAQQREANKKADAKRALQKELADAVDPKPFDPKARYKAGEIIVHPEHGRGKIENVLKSSLLVRFLEGLRPLDLT